MEGQQAGVDTTYTTIEPQENLLGGVVGRRRPEPEEQVAILIVGQRSGVRLAHVEGDVRQRRARHVELYTASAIHALSLQWDSANWQTSASLSVRLLVALTLRLLGQEGRVARVASRHLGGSPRRLPAGDLLVVPSLLRPVRFGVDAGCREQEGRHESLEVMHGRCSRRETDLTRGRERQAKLRDCA